MDVQINDNSREAKMRRKMCKLWTNFAKFGNPTPDYEKSLPFRWTSSSKKGQLEYLVIDDEEKTEMHTNLNKPRLEFWRRVYQKFNRNFTPSKL